MNPSTSFQPPSFSLSSLPLSLISNLKPSLSLIPSPPPLTRMNFNCGFPLSQWSAEDDATLTNALGNYSVDTNPFQWYCDVARRLNGKTYQDIALRIRELRNEQPKNEQPLVLDQVDGSPQQANAHCKVEQVDDGVHHVSGARIKVESEASFSRPN